VSAYLLDTNHLGTALRAPLVHDRVISAARAGHRIGTCVPVLCEVAVGFAQTPRPEKNWKALGVFLNHVRVWPIEPAVARVYGDIYRELRAKGRVLSQVDMMVAAMARQSGLIVLTTDRDFEAVAGIDVENWVSGS
jgi:predicted nucleic acid-binding protein